MEPSPQQIVPHPGEVWEYKGHKYIVVRNGFQVKDPNDSNWYDGVMYQSMPIAGQPVADYVRRMDDFLAKFSKQ